MNRLRKRNIKHFLLLFLLAVVLLPVRAFSQRDTSLMHTFVQNVFSCFKMHDTARFVSLAVNEDELLFLYFSSRKYNDSEKQAIKEKLVTSGYLEYFGDSVRNDVKKEFHKILSKEKQKKINWYNSIIYSYLVDSSDFKKDGTMNVKIRFMQDTSFFCIKLGDVRKIKGRISFENCYVPYSVESPLQCEKFKSNYMQSCIKAAQKNMQEGFPFKTIPNNVSKEQYCESCYRILLKRDNCLTEMKDGEYFLPRVVKASPVRK